MTRIVKVTYSLAAAVAFLTFFNYLSSLQNEFVEWDDSRYVFENPHIRSFDLTFLKWAFFDFYAANWHPLTWISHSLDYALWGLNPLGHHLTNNILHSVNTLLVVVLVVRLVEASKPASWKADKLTSFHYSHFIAAGVTGLLFGIHPVHVESVAWVAERKDLLCALFYLLSVLAYLRYAAAILLQGAKDNVQRAERKEQGAVSSVRYAPGPMLCALCFFILALLSKPMAVSLPLVLLILDWYPLNRVDSLKTFRAAFIEKLPFIFLSVISSILTIMAQNAEKAMQMMEFVQLQTRAIVAARSLIAYLWKMAVPLDLIPYYPYPKDPSFFSFEYLSAVVLVAGVTAACIIAAKKQKLWLSVWGYFVITLLPVIGIVQVGGQSMADRYTYLPSIGPFLLIGFAAAWISTKWYEPKKRDKIVMLSSVAVALFVVVSMSFLTVSQIGIWKNSIALWSYVIERQDAGVSIAYNNRGKVFIDKGRLDEAIADFDKAIALDQFYYRAYYNRGFVFDKMGRLDEAIADFDKAIVLAPSFHEAYYNRGLTYNKTGLFDKAIESLSKSLEIDPDDVDALVSRGISYALIGRNDRAFEDFNKAILLNRTYVLAYLNRGKLLLNTSKRELAMLDFQEACGLGSQEGCDRLQVLQLSPMN